MIDLELESKIFEKYSNKVLCWVVFLNIGKVQFLLLIISKNDINEKLLKKQLSYQIYKKLI